MRLVLIGPPGSGKGTQAGFLKSKYRLLHISTGDLLRQEVHFKSSLGLKVKQYLDQGELLPDVMMIKILFEKLIKEDCDHGFLLDGFPRTLNQAQGLDKMLLMLQKKEKRSEIDFVIHFRVELTELMKRLLFRKDREGRTDDEENTIKRRLEFYYKEQVPLIDYYKKRRILRQIDGFGSIEEVRNRIIDKLN